jgi:hypothetical protein
MRQQLLVTISLSIILLLSIYIKFAFFPKPDGHTAYYFQSTFWICGLLITVISLNLIWNAFVHKKGAPRHRPHAFWPNRRNTFRIIYPTFIRPALIVETIDDRPKRQLEFSIVDLSQEGSCFIDDGSLGEMKSFSGCIRFRSGVTVSISGQFIRRRGDHVSVRFRHAINWPTLLEEQRQVLVHMKPVSRHLS